MAEAPKFNEYKVCLRVKEDALQTFYLLHPAFLIDYGMYLRNSLAVDKYVVFQCARNPHKLLIARADDVSFLTVEALEPADSDVEKSSGVKNGQRGKPIHAGA